MLHTVRRTTSRTRTIAVHDQRVIPSAPVHRQPTLRALYVHRIAPTSHVQRQVRQAAVCETAARAKEVVAGSRTHLGARHRHRGRARLARVRQRHDVRSGLAIKYNRMLHSARRTTRRTRTIAVHNQRVVPIGPVHRQRRARALHCDTVVPGANVERNARQAGGGLSEANVDRVCQIRCCCPCVYDQVGLVGELNGLEAVDHYPQAAIAGGGAVVERDVVGSVRGVDGQGRRGRGVDDGVKAGVGDPAGAGAVREVDGAVRGARVAVRGGREGATGKLPGQLQAFGAGAAVEGQAGERNGIPAVEIDNQMIVAGERIDDDARRSGDTGDGHVDRVAVHRCSPITRLQRLIGVSDANVDTVDGDAERVVGIAAVRVGDREVVRPVQSDRGRADDRKHHVIAAQPASVRDRGVGPAAKEVWDGRAFREAGERAGDQIREVVVHDHELVAAHRDEAAPSGHVERDVAADRDRASHVELIVIAAGRARRGAADLDREGVVVRERKVAGHAQDAGRLTGRDIAVQRHRGSGNVGTRGVVDRTAGNGDRVEERGGVDGDGARAGRGVADGDAAEAVDQLR